MDPLTLILVILLVIWLTGTVYVGSSAIHFILIVVLVLLVMKAIR